MSPDPSSPVPAPPGAVTCFHCGVRTEGALPACPECATSFRRLCACDREMSAFAEACPHCGLAHHPPTYAPPVPKRRIVFLALLALAVVAATAAYFVGNRDDRAGLEPWRLKQRALERMEEGRLDDARRDVQAALERTPRDEQAWFLLAVVDKELGLPAEEYRAAARKALEYEPRFAEALTFLAIEYRDDGDGAEARRLVETAARLPEASASTWRLLGELELERPDADAGRALAALERAHELGDRDPRLLSQRAVLRIRLLGYAPPSRYPADVKRILDETDAALGRLDPAERDAPDLLTLRAEIQLALGQFSNAIELADRSLAATRPREGDEPDPRTAVQRGRAFLVRARAEAVAERPDEVLAALESALDLPGGSAAADRVVALLHAQGMSDRIPELLEPRIDDDPTGTVALALTADAVARGDADAARAFLARLGEDAGASTRARLVRSEVARLEGRLDDAAAELDVILDDPAAGETARLARALLALEHPGELQAWHAGVLRALQDLESHPDAQAPELRSARFSAALGALRLAAGDAEGAHAAFGHAVEREPWTPRYRVGLARATSRLDAPDAAERAAAEYARAAALRPHDAELVQLVARAQIANGDPARAVGACTVYLEAHPRDLSVRRTRAEALRAIGHWKSTARDLRHLADAGVADPAELRWLVVAYERAGLLDVAREMVVRERASGRTEQAALVQRAIDEVTGVADVAPLPPGDSISRAAKLLGDGNAAAGRAMARRLLAERPGSESALQYLVLSLFTKGTDDAERARVAADLQSAATSDSPPDRGVLEYLRGCLALARGDEEDAVARLSRAATFRSADPQVVFFHGQALFAAGRRHAALPVLRRALLLDAREKSPFAGPIAERLVQVAIDVSDPLRRERLLVEALALDPSDLRATVLLFESYSERGAFEDGAALVERRIARGGLDDDVLLDFHRRALAMRLAGHDLPRALPHLEALAERGADDGTTAALRGWALIQSGKFDEARTFFRESLAADPESRAATFGMLRSLVNLDEIETARALVRQWRTAVAGDGGALHGELIRQLVRRGHLAAAGEEARAALEVDATDVRALTLLVWSHELLGDSGAAVSRVRKALDSAADGQRPELTLLLAEVLQRTGAPAGEIQPLLAPFLDDAGTAPALQRRAAVVSAEVAARDGKAADAARLLARVTSTWPEDEQGRRIPEDPNDRAIEHRVRFVQGLLAVGEGRVADAAAYFGRTVQLNGLHATAMNNMAWCLAQDEATAAKSVPAAAAATRMQPKNPDFWDTRATCEAAADQVEAALTSYQRAAALYAEERPTRAGPRSESALRFAKLLHRSGRKKQAADVARGILAYVESGPTADAARRLVR